MKTPRGLSGIYFRTPDESGKWVNRAFEDLSEAEQDRVMKERGEDWLKSLAKQLANTLNMIGDKFDIITGEE